MRGKTKLIKIAWLHILGKYLVKVQTLSLLFSALEGPVLLCKVS